MDYPFWDVKFGYGAMMGIFGVIHVFISHFAIGGGLYLVIAEIRAQRANDTVWLDYLRRLSKFFTLLTVVLGALTGVGIWFIVGLLNPAAVMVLIRNFVWIWAIEWTFFIVEIFAAIIYFYGWERMSLEGHIKIGWIYFISSYLSLLAINGIICFMLTPGAWLKTGSLWDGLLNPTFMPSLIARTGICILLAGLYSQMNATTHAAIRRYNAVWAAIGAIIIAPSVFWYWHAIPVEMQKKIVETMRYPLISLKSANVLLAVLFIVIILGGVVRSRVLGLGLAIIAMALGFAWFWSFEMFRESARKPYVIEGFMYGNGIEAESIDTYQEDGMIEHMQYVSRDNGADLFRRACRSCHTISGYHPLKGAFDGTDEDFIAAIVKGVSVIKGNMPPFAGSENDAELIAEYIYKRIDTRPISDIYRLGGMALGKKVFDIRCGKCHEIGGYNDISKTIEGAGTDDLNNLLDTASDMSDEMPPFTGNIHERTALISYLLYIGGKH